MNGQVNWVILYRFIDGLPCDFLEVRRHSHRIWICRGRSGTFGHDAMELYQSESCAIARYQALLLGGKTDGFIVAAEGRYPPGSFDLDAFKSTLKSSTLRCVAAMRINHAHETLCGFAYLTDDDVMTISGVVNTQESISQETEPDLKEEARFNVSAWAHDAGSEWLDVPYRMLLWQFRLRLQANSSTEQHAKASGSQLFERPQPIGSFRKTVFEAMVATLCELRQEGTFEEFGEDFVLLVQVADSEQIPGMVTRLNSDSAFTAGYRAFIGSD